MRREREKKGGNFLFLIEGRRGEHLFSSERGGEGFKAGTDGRREEKETLFPLLSSVPPPTPPPPTQVKTVSAAAAAVSAAAAAASYISHVPP